MENWPFLKVAISPKPKRSHPSKLMCMHVTSIPTCMNFLSRFRSIKFFDDHYSTWSERENWLFLKVAISPKPKRACQAKIGVHELDINPYMHEFFELILID